MFTQLKRSPAKGQCHKHGSQDCQQERKNKQQKRKTCIVCFPISSLFAVLLLPFSVSHGAFKSWFTFIHKQSNFFVFCQHTYSMISCQNTVHASLAKAHGRPAQSGIISANKASSEAKGCPGCPRNAGLAFWGASITSWCLHSTERRVTSHLTKHFLYPMQRNIRSSFIKIRAGNITETDQAFAAKLKETFCRYIRIPLEYCLAV